MLTQRQINRRRYYQENKAKAIEQNAIWQAANAEKMRDYRAGYRARNREKIQKAGRAWARKKRLEGPEYDKRYYTKHRAKIKIRSRNRLLALKRETMNAYGSVCACCGAAELEFLCLDHIANDGKQHRKELGTAGLGNPFYRYLKRNGFPQGRLQVLCLNCNGAKAYYGQCPHQKGMVNAGAAI